MKKTILFRLLPVTAILVSGILLLLQGIPLVRHVIEYGVISFEGTGIMFLIFIPSWITIIIISVIVLIKKKGG